MILVTVTGTYKKPDGTAASGFVTFTPAPQIVADTSNDTLVVADTVSAVLDSTGSFSVQVASSTDTNLSPHGWTYTVHENIEGVAPRTYSVDISDATSPVNLFDLAPVPQVLGGLRLVPGPQGAQGIQGPAGNEVERTFPSLQGRLVSLDSFTSSNPAAQTATGTARVPFFVAADTTDLRCSFTHRYNTGSSTFQDTIPTSDLVGLRATLEINGSLYPMTVNGQVVFNIGAGGIVQSDPIPVEVLAGSIVYVRTFMPSGMMWYYNRFTSAYSSGSGGFTATTDLTPKGSVTIPDSSNKLLWTAHSITGTHLNSRRPVALLIGDSIANGAGDAYVPSASYVGVNVANPAAIGGGYVVRACRSAGIPVANAGISGDAFSAFVIPINRWFRTSVAPDVSNVICEYGRNDISVGGTLATIQAGAITAWLLFSRRGIKVFQPTITPLTGSPDGWTTTIHQVPNNTEPVRVLFNNWLRDGAPLDGATFAPVTTGTSPAGTIRAGSAGHPLSASFEVADVVETARDSGIWVAPTNLRTVSGASTTAAGFTVTSVTAQFSAADVGRKFVITGAGPGGNPYVGLAQSFNSTTSMTMSTAITNTVSATSISVCDNNTADGTHPGSYLHALMALSVPTGSFV